MSKFTSLIVLSIGLLLSVCYGDAQTRGNFSVGFIVGEPTGISWKYRINAVHAVDGVVGFSPFDRFRINVDYLWNAQPFEEQNLLLYYGVGGAIGFGRTEYITSNGRYAYLVRNEPLGFGARTVIGLNYSIPKSPVELMFEAAPIVILAPNAGFGIDAGFGARFFF